MKKSDKVLVEFDEEVWNGVIEDVKVESEGGIRFRFKDGMEIEWNM